MNGKTVQGLYLGAGTSALYLGFGFVPDQVKLQGIDQSTVDSIDWDIHMARAATAAEGLSRVAIEGDITVLTLGNGIQPYYGGDVIATASANYQVLADTVAAYAGDMRQKTGTTINKWTLDVAATYKGHWNVACDTTYVGVGSEVRVKDASGVIRTAFITAITTTGEESEEVTLSLPLASGEILFIGYMYDFVTAPVGTVMPAGISVAAVEGVNKSAEKAFIRATQVDANL